MQPGDLVRVTDTDNLNPPVIGIYLESRNVPFGDWSYTMFTLLSSNGKQEVLAVDDDSIFEVISEAR